MAIEIGKWEVFQTSGKIGDYLAYKSDEKSIDVAEAKVDADKNSGNCPETAQFR